MKKIKCLICILLLPIFLFGCAGSDLHSYSQIEKDYQNIKSNSASMTEKELCTAMANLFQNIANGSESEVDQFADLFREITNNKVEFENKDVFVLAGDYAKLYSQLADGSAELGIQTLEVKSTADSAVQVEVSYKGDFWYSVKMIEKGEDWQEGEFTAPYKGELGEYLVAITVNDATVSSKFDEKYPNGSIHNMGALFSGSEAEVKVRGVYNSDHGYVIYISCDQPFSAEEQESTTLSRPMGSVCVTLKPQ